MDLATLIPPGGLGAIGTGGLLVMVVLYLLNANRQDRKEYQEAIDKAEKRADDAEVRKREAEVSERAAHQLVDAERVARRAAEDRADALSRELASLRPPEPGGPP